MARYSIQRKRLTLASSTSRELHRVLIVDDDPDTGEAVARMVLSLGFAARFIRHGSEVAAALSGFQPTHIIVDLMLPEIDGVEILESLAGQGCTSSIMILSGAGQRIVDAAQRASLQFGLSVVGVAQKPLSLETLKRMLTRVRRVPEMPELRTSSALPSIGRRDMQTALEDGQFFPAFEPKLRSRSHKLVGYEAVLRWNHPEKGLLTPTDFIECSDECGLLDAVTDHFFSLALHAIKDHLAVHDLHLAFNLSPLHLSDRSLPERLSTICANAGVNPGQIFLEITERVAFLDSVSTLALATRLRLRGFRLSIDEFGSGTCSLAQVANLPFSELKISPALTRALCTSNDAQRLVSSIVKFGHGLKLSVTAEGVEDEKSSKILDWLDCDLVQGKYFAGPMTEEELAHWNRPPLLTRGKNQMTIGERQPTTIDAERG